MPHVEAVVVIDADGEPLWRQSLTSRKPIEHWVTHIGDRRSWSDHRLYKSFAGAFASEVSVE